jgi:hypothetical protein
MVDGRSLIGIGCWHELSFDVSARPMRVGRIIRLIQKTRTLVTVGGDKRHTATLLQRATTDHGGCRQATGRLWTWTQGRHL